MHVARFARHVLADRRQELHLGRTCALRQVRCNQAAALFVLDFDDKMSHHTQLSERHGGHELSAIQSRHDVVGALQCHRRVRRDLARRRAVGVRQPADRHDARLFLPVDELRRCQRMQTVHAVRCMRCYFDTLTNMVVRSVSSVSSTRCRAGQPTAGALSLSFAPTDVTLTSTQRVPTCAATRSRPARSRPTAIVIRASNHSFLSLSLSNLNLVIEQIVDRWHL